ncbi:MAG: ROK family protein [Myxococcota bacterium]
MAPTESADPDGVVVGVDIGGTKVALMLADLAHGETLAVHRFPTPAREGPEAVLAGVDDGVGCLLRQASRPRSALRALGVAVPGQVDVDRGLVLEAGNLEGWHRVPLREVLQRRHHVPVFLEQDANAAALGERWRGIAREMHNFIFLALGTGVGAGIVINGRIRRGFHHAAGEVGNFILGRQYLGGGRCGHGNLEQLVGGPALRARMKQLTGRESHTGELFKQAQGDARLRQLADEVADHVAMAVVNMSALLDPEAIIFGGGSAVGGELFLTPVRERVQRELPVVPLLLHSALGTDAQMHGAVFGALWQLDPSLALREELR